MNKRSTEMKNIDFDGAPHWLMEYCAKLQKEGKIAGSLYTDDFEYADWQNIVPQEWIDEAAAEGNANNALQKYFDTMSVLERLFFFLSDYQIHESDYFPEDSLYIKIKTGDTIKMHYITGQGSDFSISLVKDTDKLPLGIDWDYAMQLVRG